MPLGSIFDFPPRPAPQQAPPGAPTQDEAVRNEIDHHENLNQTDWSGTPQNEAVQNEIDYYNRLNQTERPQDHLW